jgi:hypothetical protein
MRLWFPVPVCHERKYIVPVLAVYDAELQRAGLS